MDDPKQPEAGGESEPLEETEDFFRTGTNYPRTTAELLKKMSIKKQEDSP